MISLFVIALLSVPVDRTPPAPTVGDPVTLTFHISGDERIAVEPSPDYEVISAARARTVVRSFAPKSFTVQAAIIGPSGQRVISVIVPMKSVLAAHDSMQPAPLQPPRPEPLPRLPFLAMAIAAALCAAAWAALALANRRKNTAVAEIAEAPPAAEFLAALARLRRSARREGRAAALADITRHFLARIDPVRFGPELTSLELRPAVAAAANAEWSALVTEILAAGDQEKFSPWPGSSEVTDRLLEKAGALPRPFEPLPEKVAA